VVRLQNEQNSDVRLTTYYNEVKSIVHHRCLLLTTFFGQIDTLSAESYSNVREQSMAFTGVQFLLGRL
jgi:hypothetical protein